MADTIVTIARWDGSRHRTIAISADPELTALVARYLSERRVPDADPVIDQIESARRAVLIELGGRASARRRRQG